jgi:hypothetical protein
MRIILKYVLTTALASIFLSACQRKIEPGMSKGVVLPSSIESVTEAGSNRSYNFRYNEDHQITQIITEDSSEFTFHYVDRLLSKISKKFVGSTEMNIHAEFRYEAGELRQIVSHITGEPLIIDILYDPLTNLYTTHVQSDTYQFQFEENQGAVYQNSALKEEAVILNSKREAGPFKNASIPLALSLYYSFYDAADAFLFFNKKMVQEVNYKDLDQVRKYTYQKNSNGWIETIQINDGKINTEEIAIRY